MHSVAAAAVRVRSGLPPSATTIHRVQSVTLVVVAAVGSCLCSPIEKVACARAAAAGDDSGQPYTSAVASPLLSYDDMR
jgi:hypothetical protein